MNEWKGFPKEGSFISFYEIPDDETGITLGKPYQVGVMWGDEFFTDDDGNSREYPISEEGWDDENYRWREIPNRLENK